jgi:hypothetical protein
MAGTPVGARHAPTFPASSSQSDQAGSPFAPSVPHGPRFKPRLFCRATTPIDSVDFTLKAGLVHRLLEHVIDVSDGAAAWLEVDERERPKPPPDDVSLAVRHAQDAAMRGLCIASLELIGDQAKRLSGWVCDQQFRAPEFGVMQPRRRRPPGQPG